jgi:hypothetical protein
LCYEYKGNKAEVGILDAHIDYGLRKEWESHLQAAAEYHAHNQLGKLLLVWKKISDKMQQVATGAIFLFVSNVLEVGSGCKHQCCTARLSAAVRGNPAFLHCLFLANNLFAARVGYVELRLVVSPLLYLVAHYKMILIPMQYTWQWDIVYKLFQCYFNTDASKAYCLGCITYAQHGYTFAGDETFIPQC